MRKGCFRFAMIAFFVIVAVMLWENRPVHVDLDMSGPTAEWLDYGNDRGGKRYSPVSQITKENVKHLESAWEYNHGDIADGNGEFQTTSAFEATPILIDGTLYCPTPFNRLIALDPETGEEKWVFDAEIEALGNYSNQLVCRGVTHWSDEDGEGRLFMGTLDGRLIAIDTVSGQPVPGFGEDGIVDLMKDEVEQAWDGEYSLTSPPAVCNNIVVVGSAIGDNTRVDAPSGVVRGYDAETGALKWSWDLRPPNYDPPEEMLSPSGHMLGTPNVWAPMSSDEELGMVYVPTGNPAPDYYGGKRNGADFYGSSVVALDAETGEVKWHFQTVHHDLWDFDVPAQPTLVDLQRDGETVPALIQATKMGLLFILNRETGEPIFEIEERPVPQSTVPGEETSPTQPFPVKPPPLVRQTISGDDAWGPFGIGKDDCRETIEGMVFEGMYTPPALEQFTIMYPGNAGGSNWGGVAVDPEKQILIANVMDMPWAVGLFPNDDLDALSQRFPNDEIGAQHGTPYAVVRKMLISPLELPCNAPPWGTLNAVDLNTGDILWTEEFGTVRDLAPVPIPIKYGVPNLGGPVITGSGVVFIAAAMDNYLRAYDIDTGKELWKGRLPAGGQATPMTYRVRPDGKQFVVICAGGHGRAGTQLGDSIIAFSLPE